MKKRICIITSSYPANKQDSKNAGIFVRDFARLLSKNYQVSVLAPDMTNTKKIDPEIDVYYFPWISSELGLSSLNPKNPLHFLKLLSLIISGIFFTLKFLRKNSIDHCIAMWAVPAGLFALVGNIFFKIPYSIWALGSDIWKIQTYPLGKYILKKVLAKATQLFADGVVLSNDVEKLSKRKCIFLPSSRLLEKKIIDVDYKKFDSTKLNFLYIGRYHQNKGIDILIDAISMLDNNEKKNVLFHIFGGGPLENDIKTKIKNLGLQDIVFINSYLDGRKVFSFMSKADLIIIPSRIESIPVILSDAMQSNKPVFVTDVGDMGNLVKKFNVGLVVAPTPQGIASGIKKVIQLGKENLEPFVQNSNSLSELLNLKRSVLSFQKLFET